MVGLYRRGTENGISNELPGFSRHISCGSVHGQEHDQEDGDLHNVLHTPAEPGIDQLVGRDEDLIAIGVLEA
jgi:hypothetical protein